MARSADAPGAQLRRVVNGTSVGVIHLSHDHRLLLDARSTKPNDVHAVQLNANRALCWSRQIPDGLARRCFK